MRPLATLRPALVALLTVATLVQGSPALAGSPTLPVDSQTGRTGNHYLVDAVIDPGGTCRYGYQADFGFFNGLFRIAVKAPVAFARATRQQQRITWRLRTQVWKDNDWKKVKDTEWISGMATPSSPAPFTARSLRTVHRKDAPQGPYRARIDLRWYDVTGEKVVGTARMFPVHYRSIQSGTDRGTQQYDCGGTLG